MEKVETKKVSFRLPVDLLDRVAEARWMRRKSVTEVVIEALLDYCARHAVPVPGREDAKMPEESRIPPEAFRFWGDI